MSEAKFTNGPWESFRYSDGEHKGLYIKQVGDKGLFLVKHTFDGIQAEANVKLMAAAPDMYEALREIIDCQEHFYTEQGGVRVARELSPWSGPLSVLFRTAHQALVKAQGGESQ